MSPLMAHWLGWLAVASVVVVPAVVIVCAAIADRRPKRYERDEHEDLAR